MDFTLSGSQVFLFVYIMFSVTDSSLLLHKQTCHCSPGREVILLLYSIQIADDFSCCIVLENEYPETDVN